MSLRASPAPGVVRSVSLNPAVDVSMTVQRLEPVHKLRAFGATREAGGGGVNVARVLTRLSVPVECVVAVGGGTGVEVTDALTQAGVPWRALDVNGATRESVQIVDRESGLRYRLVLDGPPLRNDPIEAIEMHRDVEPATVIVLSGSLPTGSEDSTYQRLVTASVDPFTIVDTSGAALTATVRGRVDLVKPSLSELETLADHTIEDADALREALAQVLDDHTGVGAILVSLGDCGAVLAERTSEFTLLQSPPVPAVSAVGAGDAMVAGVAARVHAGDSLLDAAKYGVACGAATVTTPGSELCRRETVDDLFGEVRSDPLRSRDVVRSDHGGTRTFDPSSSNLGRRG